MQPNIVYVVVHDLGRYLGAYGAGVSTPNLDRFAAEGALFEQAFCNSPACSPSRGCAMSGQYAHTNGLMGLVNSGWSMPESTRTIVDYLNDAGYETAQFGFQHERWSYDANRYSVHGPWDGLSDGYVENAVGLSVRFLEERDRSRPFYLNIGTVEVHATQWQARNPWSRPEVFGPGPAEDAFVPECMPDVPQVREEVANLHACTEYLDAQIQTLFDALRRLGYEENTLVVFTTDHGLPGMRGKGTLYLHGVDIALLMRMPGTIPAGMRVDHMIQNIDFVPTMLEAAGADIPSEVQGRSFWPLLTGGEYQPHDKIFLERNYHGGHAPKQPVPEGSTTGWDPMRSVRTPRFTYIHNYDPEAKREWLPGEVTEFKDTYDHWVNELWPEPSLPRDPEELFDRSIDPLERNNVAADPAYSDVLRELSADVDRWMQETDDPLLKGRIPDRLNGWPAGAAQ